MRNLRLRLASLPIFGYGARWAVVADGYPFDFALTRRAALRRRPVGIVYSNRLQDRV